MLKNKLLVAFNFCLSVFFLVLTSVSIAQTKDIQSDNFIISNSRLNTILTENNLRVCVWPDYYSISYHNTRDYTWSGIDIDLANILADDLGVNLTLVNSSFVTLIADVLNNSCDIAMFAIGINEQRKKYLRFTSPYLASDILAITTKTNRKIKEWDDIDKTGNIVSVVQGTIYDSIMHDYLKKATVSVVESSAQREKDLLSGRSDVFITDFPYVVRLLDKTDWARLVMPPKKFHMTYYAWAILPGDDVWYEQLQSFMYQIKHDKRLITVARKYGLESIVVLD